MAIERCRVATAGNSGGGTFGSLFHGDDAPFDGRDDFFGFGFHARFGYVGYQRGHVERSDGGFQGYYQQGDHGGDYSFVTALHFRYFPEYLEFRPGFGCVGRVCENYRDDIFLDDSSVVYPILYCRDCIEEESVPVVPEYVTGLYDGFGNTVFCGNDSRDTRAIDKNGVNRELAAFVIPLCATIHLSGSTMKIVACAMAIMLMSGMPISFGVMAGFIFMLGIAMVAARGTGRCDHGGFGVIAVHAGI